MTYGFCGACGAALNKGAAFCGACGSPAPASPPMQVVVAPQPLTATTTQPAQAPPPYQPLGALPSAGAYQQPAAATLGQGFADWGSVEVQPAETALGNWVVGLLGPQVTGSLTVTDRRILFKPRVAGSSLFGMLFSQTKYFKDAHTIVLAKDQLASVRCEKGMVNTKVIVTEANGVTYTFNRSLMSADSILAALNVRAG